LKLEQPRNIINRGLFTFIMLKISFYYFLFFSLSINTACKKSGTPIPGNTTNEFFEVSINGQKFTNSWPPGFINLSGFTSITCDNKPGYLINILDSDLNSRYQINTDLQHYHNNVNFGTGTTGNFGLTDGPLLPGSPSYCHFTLYFALKDKTLSNQRTTLQPGGNHIVNSIKTLSNSSGRKEVLVEGTFQGTFKNSSNTNISVSGNYKKIIEILI